MAEQEKDLALTFTEKATAVAAIGAALVVGTVYAAAEKISGKHITHRGMGF